MKITLLFASASLPLWAWASWKVFQAPMVKVKVEERVVQPEKVDAYVSLTKWQLDKMLSEYEEGAHPSDMLKFKTIVKSDGSEWRISSTHLVKNSNPYPIPQGRFLVVDSSYVDYSGDFKSCVEYANSYDEFHNYIVISSE